MHIRNARTPNVQIRATFITAAALTLAVLSLAALRAVLFDNPPKAAAPRWKSAPVTSIFARVHGLAEFRVNQACILNIIEILSPSVRRAAPADPYLKSVLREENAIERLILNYADGNSETLRYYFSGNTPLVYTLGDATFCRPLRTESEMRIDHMRLYGINEAFIDESASLTDCLTNCSLTKLRPAGDTETD